MSPQALNKFYVKNSLALKYSIAVVLILLLLLKNQGTLRNGPKCREKFVLIGETTFLARAKGDGNIVCAIFQIM